MMLGEYANVFNEPRNPESSVFFAIAHRELDRSAEEALQVLSTEQSTLPLKATFEGVMRGDRARTVAQFESAGGRFLIES